MRILFLSIFLVFSLTACVSTPARDTDSTERPKRYKDYQGHNHDHGGRKGR